MTTENQFNQQPNQAGQGQQFFSAQDQGMPAMPQNQGNFPVQQRVYTQQEIQLATQRQNTRPPEFKPIEILEVRRYSDKGGNPRVSFNFGSLHLSYRQLMSAGVFYPESLIGKTISVDFFKRGDILLNGSEVRDNGIIVNRFAIEGNAEVANEIEKELRMSAHHAWASKLNTAFGANQRPSGIGTGNMLDNGVQRVASPGSQTDFSQSPAAQQINQQTGGPAIIAMQPLGTQTGTQGTTTTGNAQPMRHETANPVADNLPGAQPSGHFENVLPNTQDQNNQTGGQDQTNP